MKLTNNQVVVLEVLAGAHALFGMEIVRLSLERLAAGTIYATLLRMEELGLLSSEIEVLMPPKGIPRRLYTITGQGRFELTHHVLGTAGVAP